MRSPQRRDRRGVLGCLAVVLTGVVSGCSADDDGGGGVGDPPVGGAEASGSGTPPPCAEGFRIVDRQAEVDSGTAPEVTFRFHNAASDPVAYELTVEFRQGTSLGIPARTGREERSGTIPPGDTVSVTATGDGYETENTDSYDFAVSVSCPSG
jgi:hypothetical protein